jgi:hypothetical protein
VILLAIVLLATSVAIRAFAGEEVTEHETYEKRSMKIETIPVQPTTTLPNRVCQHHEETTTVDAARTTPPPVVEEQLTVPKPITTRPGTGGGPWTGRLHSWSSRRPV